MTPDSNMVALDVLEACEGDFELVALADAIAQTHRHRVAERRFSPRLTFVLAAALLVIAAPAYALVRSGVIFSNSPPASSTASLHLESLDAAAPIGMSPRVDAHAARQVGTFPIGNGASVDLAVAPTQGGGFCEEWGGLVATCADDSVPLVVGTASANGLAAGPNLLRFIFGHVVAPNAEQILVRFPDGSSARTSLVHVDAPIDAAFFLYVIAGDSVFPSSVDAVSATGQVLATEQIPAPKPELARP